MKMRLNVRTPAHAGVTKSERAIRALMMTVVSLMFIPGTGAVKAFADEPTINATPQKDLGKKESHIRDMLRGGLAQAKASFAKFSPGDKYRQTLPAQAVVVSSKDQKAFQSYGGLSEVYLFDGEDDKAHEVLTWLSANNIAVMGADSPYLGLIYNDFGLYYWNKKSPDESEKMLTLALPSVEKAAQADPERFRDNLISLYGALSVLYFDKDQKELAQYYLEKMKPLTAQQQQQSK